MSLENGKTLSEAKGEVAYAASFVQWFGEEAARAYGDTIPSSTPHTTVLTFKEPVGVCGIITPWNFPAAMITRKIAPAFAAGCAVVVKPPSETPFSCAALTKLAVRAGLPPKVLQVLPTKDPEVAAALEAELLRRGVRLFKGARAESVRRTDDGVSVACDDGRVARGSHALLAVGSIPNSEGLGLEHAGVTVDRAGYIPINHHCQSNVGHIYAAGDLSGKLPLSSVAAMQGRKIAEHVMGMHTRDHRHLDYEKAASASASESAGCTSTLSRMSVTFRLQVTARAITEISSAA